MSDVTAKELLALSLSQAISPRQLHMYYESQSRLQSILHLTHEEIRQYGLLKQKKPQGEARLVYEGGEALLEKAEEVLRSCRKLEIEVIAYNDEKYPSSLRHISNPPLVLYARGKSGAINALNLRGLGSKAIAVVGTRRSEIPINETTKMFAKEISKEGLCVVSGMAAGVDRFAHLGALEAQVKTVAVLAGGADYIYPYGNRDIYKKIIEEGGLILAEHPPGTPPKPYYFPSRNRIIAGISAAVFVVQAPEKSGAMITAMQGVEQGKIVYCLSVPKDDSEHFAGNRFLQNAGAIMVSNARQLLDDFNLTHETLPTGMVDESDEEVVDKVLEEVEEILVFLHGFPRSIEEIATITGKTMEEARVMIMEMRLSGLVKELPGNRFCAS